MAEAVFNNAIAILYFRHFGPRMRDVNWIQFARLPVMEYGARERAKKATGNRFYPEMRLIV